MVVGDDDDVLTAATTGARAVELELAVIGNVTG